MNQLIIRHGLIGATHVTWRYTVNPPKPRGNIESEEMKKKNEFAKLLTLKSTKKYYLLKIRQWLDLQNLVVVDLHVSMLLIPIVLEYLQRITV